MNNMRLVSGFAAVAVLAGCAAPMIMGVKTVSSNCQVPGLSACRVIITASSGSPPTFVATPDAAIAPSNASSNVDLYWVLPAGYNFFPGDGVVLGNPLPFSNPFVTNAAGAPSLGPDVGYHWTMNLGLAQVFTKYTVVFHEVGLSGKGQGWSCDPTISNFGDGVTRGAPSSGMSCVRVP